MSALPMFHAYQKAAQIAATTGEPAIIIALVPDSLDQYDALPAEEYHRRPACGFFFDTIAPEEV